MLAVALASVLGLSSCLNKGENGGTFSNNEIMKADPLTGTYISQLGYKVRPLNVSDMAGLSLTSDYIQLHYTYDYTQDMSDGEVEATVYGYSLISEGRMLPQAPVAGDGNMPVSDIEMASNNPNYYFYKLEDMFLPIEFFVRADVDMNNMEEREAEMATHQFSLYYKADNDFSENGMTLHLRHFVQDREADDTFSKPSGGWWHFNLIDALNYYRRQYGKAPEKIIISYEQNTRDASYDGNSVSERTVTVDYKSMAEAYNAAVGSGSRALHLLMK